MAKKSVKVYIEWINYEGKVQSRDLIATFNAINWAKKFVEDNQEVVNSEISRMVIDGE